MPKTKFQGIIFGLFMSYTMAVGMEIYNISINMGIHLQPGSFSSMTNEVFLEAFKESAYMGIIVFIFSNLWGNRLGAAFAAKYTDPERDNPYIFRIMRQAGTVAVMCPTMSLAASVLFNIVLTDGSFAQLPAIWVGTVIKNFPAAFFLNMFVAAPLTHFLFNKIFREGNNR